MAKEGANAQVRLPSGEVRMISMDAKATIGTVSNADHSNVRIGKAGRTVTWASVRASAAWL